MKSFGLKSSENLFLPLLATAVNPKCPFPDNITVDDWQAMYGLSKKHSVIGLTFNVMDSLDGPQRPSLAVYAKWALNVDKIRKFNELLDQRSKELFNILHEVGLKSCILKGQGTAKYYDNPELRQSGDIDVWINEPREKTLEILKSKGFTIEEVVYHHCEVKIFDDVKVEVHFYPSFMNSWNLNKKLQSVFDKYAGSQFDNFDENLGFSVPRIDFAVLQSIIHIFRHLFHEGIGLRQFCDVFYLLKNLPEELKSQVFDDLKSLGLDKFTAALMWVESEIFNLEDKYLLCPVSENHGRFLLSEILKSGNFGQYDDTFTKNKSKSRIEKGTIKIKRLIPFFSICPAEVLAAPFFKIWQYFWRKRNAYL